MTSIRMIALCVWGFTVTAYFIINSMFPEALSSSICWIIACYSSLAYHMARCFAYIFSKPNVILSNVVNLICMRITHDVRQTPSHHMRAYNMYYSSHHYYIHCYVYHCFDKTLSDCNIRVNGAIGTVNIIVNFITLITRLIVTSVITNIFATPIITTVVIIIHYLLHPLSCVTSYMR